MAKYIFSINTGRSGSNYLYELFSHVEGCAAFHEPEPICNGSAMRRFLLGKREKLEALLPRKFQQIREAVKGGVYVETSHCFILGFGWYVPLHLNPADIGIIVLTRNREKIASSLMRIGTTPLSKVGRAWTLTPDCVSPLVAPPRVGPLGHRTSYALYRVLKRVLTMLRGDTRDGPVKGLAGAIQRYEMDSARWYVDEVAARAQDFQKRFPAINYYQVDLEELNDLAGVRKMLSHFGLREKDSIHPFIGRPTNLKT